MRHGILLRFGSDRFAPRGTSIRVPMRHFSRENFLYGAADLLLGDRTGKEALGCPGEGGPLGLFTLSSLRGDHRAGTQTLGPLQLSEGKRWNQGAGKP